MHSLVVTVRCSRSIAYLFDYSLHYRFGLQTSVVDALQVQLQHPDVLQVQLQEIDYSAITAPLHRS